MPKQKIIEKDNTGNLGLAPALNVVYVPGKSNSVFGPTLYTTSKIFKNEYPENEEKGLSYRLASYLLDLGLYVLYEGVGPVNSIPEDSWIRLQDKALYDVRFLTTGEFGYTDFNALLCASKRGDCIALCDHENLYKDEYNYILLTNSQAPADWYEQPTGKYFIKQSSYKALDQEVDFIPGKYYIKVVVSSDTDEYYAISSEPDDFKTNFSKYYELSEYSPIPLVEGQPPEYEPDTYYQRITTPTPNINANIIRTYFSNALQSITSQDDRKYGAAFTPWFETKEPRLVKELGKAELIPASFGYLFAYARSLASGNPEWYAAAGSFRGAVTEISDITYNFTDAECEILQARSVTEEVPLDDLNDNVGFAINPIANVRPFNYIVWGNRTLLVNNGNLKATSFLNIRNLVCTITKILYEAARKYTFEQNNDTLWINFQAAITPTLDKMQSGNGIIGYKFLRRPTDKKARLRAKLRIIPIEAVEDFEIEVELADSLEVTE